MPYHRTEAIVLRKTDYSNTSVVCNVFTREMGRMGLIAKGIKRGGTAYEAEPELFTINDVVFSLRAEGGMGTLTEAAVIDDMRGIGKKVERFWAACYAAELLLDLTAEFQPLPEVYEAAAAALRAVARGQKMSAIVFAFEMALLKLLGHEPRMGECVECGRRRSKGRDAAFSALKGGFLCDDCRASDANAITVRGGTAALIESFSGHSAAGGIARAERLTLTAEGAKDLRAALDYYMTFLRERPSKTREYMRALYK